MAEGIVSSFDKFAAKLPKDFDFERNAPRVSALKHYFAKGGVVSIAASENDWPKLLYPNKSRLKQQISELQELRKNYGEKLHDWKQKFTQAKRYHLLHNIKKLKEPLYWKHVAKYASDSDYRADSDSVKLPAHLISDERIGPMVKTFVNNIEYRKQLAKTVEESVLNKGNKKVGKFADDLQAFRMQQSGRQIDELEKKVSELDTDIETMNELIKWASF